MKKSSFKRSLAMFLAILMLVTSFPIMAFATNESGIKPPDKKTEGQPFVENDPSDIYRIPCMVTLDNGTIVAAADARWGSGMDGGGNDTIVSRSTDNGLNWEYTMVNYYPDNGNEFNKASTSVCDTELVTDGTNVYMLTTFFPAGYALNVNSANNQVKSGTTAFDDYGRVKLAQGTSSSYDYYLGEFDAEGPTGRAPIMNNNGTATGYYADHDYYIYNGTTKTGGNLFYSDGEYQTVKINFLLFRKSSDGGKTWSDFIPVPAKRAGEAFYGVGPGRGVYDEAHHRLIFSTYTWDGDQTSQRSSFIYTDDFGKTWTRPDSDFPPIASVASVLGRWTSENAIVQLDDDTIRCFARNGWKRMVYCDATWDGTKYNWSTYKDLYLQINGTPGKLDVGNNSGCMLSVLKYSEKLQYNGNYYDAIFISTPRDERAGGVIYTILMDDDHNIVNIDSSKHENDKQIMHTITTSGVYFGYSCLTELKDGRLGLLYEINSANDLRYEAFDATKVSGCRLPDYVGKTYYVDLNKGDLRTFNVDTDQITMYDTDDPTNTNPDYLSTAFKTRKGADIQLGDSTSENGYTGVTINAKNALYDFTKNADGTWNLYSQGVNLTVVEPGLPSSATKGTLRIVKDGDYFQFIAGGTKALYYWRSGSKINQFDQTTAFGLNGDGYVSTGAGDQAGCRFDIFRPMTVDETASSAEVSGYVKIKSLDELVSGHQYLIGCQADNGYYLVYPSMSTTNTYSHSAQVRGENNTGFFMSVNAQLKGSTTIVAGKDTYIINVADFANEILGVVEYDPVIYTHGGTPSEEMSHTEVGQFIADGTWEGEKQTNFSIRPQALGEYKIVSIKALSAPDSNGNLNAIEGADITFDYDEGKNEGILHGNLPLCDTKDYTSYKKGEYVTLKTVVMDSEGNAYTQTDRFYVASNPVAGHVVLAVANNSGNKGANAMTYLLANNSYGNTEATASDFGVGYRHNAKRMYSKYFNGGNTNNTSDPIQYGENSDWNYTGYLQNLATETVKIAGVADRNPKGKEGVTDRCVNYGTDDNSDPSASAVPVAYYYYDVSSLNNEGIIVNKQDVNTDSSVQSEFSIQLSRMAANVSGQGSGFNNSILIDYGEVTETRGLWPNKHTYHKFYKDSSVKQLSASGGATLTSINGPFGVSNASSPKSYTYQDFTTQQNTIDVQCQVTSMAKNSVASLKGIIVYTEMYQAGSYSPRLNMNLPFEILICNKQEQRTAYKNTVSTVLKSTGFTTTTWKKYVDSVLAYEEYLNNYTLRTPDEKVEGGKSLNEKLGTIGNTDYNYEHMVKSAKFDDLKAEIDKNQNTYDTGIVISSGVNYTPSSYTKFVTAYENANNLYVKSGEDLEVFKKTPMAQLYDLNDPKDLETVKKTYFGDGIRSETPGYDPDKGIHADDTPGSADRLPVQVAIEDNTKALQDMQPVLAADDSAYVAVKELYNRIDKTAYKDDGAFINETFTTYDNPTGYGDDNTTETNRRIYLEYNNTIYVDVPASAQGEGLESPIEFATKQALERMNVGKDANQSENENENQVKKYSVTFNVNGVTTPIENVTGLHNYGEVVNLPLTGAYFNPETQVAKCTATSVRDGNTISTTINVEDYAEKGYVVPVLIQNDIIFNLTVTDKAPENQVTVVDYYGTVLGVLTGTEVKVEGNRVTVGDKTVTAKISPRFEFIGWSLPDDTYPITESMVIAQYGKYIKLGSIFNVSGNDNATINGEKTFSTDLLNIELDFKSETAKYWTRTTVDEQGKEVGEETLASYENNFINFSSGENINYKAYDSIDALPADIRTQVESNIPAVHGVGYTANGKFTLSVDYSVPIDKIKDKDGNDTDEFVVEVLDAGIIFSNSNPDDLYKGSAGTTTYAAPRIAHWSTIPGAEKQSGTFTMSKSKGIDGAYMRAYVSYTSKYSGSDIPYVAYSETVYKCEMQADGSYKVTAVN